MENKKLFNKDFTIVVLGQIISLFGNAIIRFALPLYLLRETNSVALFGLVSATSFIPMILLSLVGGVIADRVNKRNIMVFLDFLTAIIMIGYTLSYKTNSLVVLLIVVLMALYGIQGAYQPAVQASIPLLVDRENIMRGNAIINMVSSLANFTGPTIGGILFGLYGIQPILVVSIICFIFSAIMEIFINIPNQKNINTSKNLFSLAYDDIKISMQFILKEKPVLFKAILIISALNLFLSSMMVVGMPALITQTLQLSDSLYGISQGVLAIGSVLGGILVGVLHQKLNIKNSNALVLCAAIALLPMVIVFLVPVTPFISYLVISIMGFLIMTFATMFSIQMMTFIQIQTPPEIVGKVISCLLGLSLCAMPIGQALYGFLFQRYGATPWKVLLGAMICSIIISLASKNIFSRLHEDKENLNEIINK
ncbi:MFS transporter [Clostridium sp. LIBA-8841]|uniref:MFS transporter n=1 Tax=Clostridium sp. LIBA-8841 TaxID=2987530 RepID=UPI002AC445FF|nr:MFS transporter [Clostridium sp. LIBA-8841]MDZ5254510.1 MFS transporter [Clostridium sp. LIBA-8841]